MSIKTTIITTLQHNVGDDFIREGIQFLLESHFKGKKIEYSYIHKHSPFSVRPWFDNIKLDLISSKIDIDRFLPGFIGGNKIIKADILIQSGAPVFWCHSKIAKPTHCSKNEWYTPLIKRRFAKLNSKPVFLNLAAGSCQTWTSTGEEFSECPSCSGFAREIVDLADLTTLRDPLAQQMIAPLNLDAPVVPCSSIFAIDRLKIKAKQPKYVALNFMKGGAHFVFGQKIDFDKWNRELKAFYDEIKKHENVVFVCHDKKEVQNAKELDPNANTFYSENYADYLEFYSEVKYGIMNRIHGAFPIMSFGRPAVIIGNDSRAKMAEVIGSNSYFVNDLTSEKLLEIAKELEKGAMGFSDRFAEIKKRAFNNYLELFQKAL